MAATGSPLRFHWSLPNAGGERMRGTRSYLDNDPAADFPGQRDFCRQAEDSGMDSLLLPIGFQRADPLTLAGIFGSMTKRLTLMVAHRSGIVSPTYFVQQVNTVAAVSAGRISVNVVLGRNTAEMRYYGDFLDHDERYRRTDEFWSICDALWRREFPVDFAGEFLKVEGAKLVDYFASPTRTRPEVYFSGGSDLALQMAVKHGDCLIRFAEPPGDLAARIAPAREHGLDVAVMCTLIARPTRDEAVGAAQRLADSAGEKGRAVQRDIRRESADSVGYARAYALGERESQWLTPYLWSGLVPYMGPPSIALVGGPDEITEAIFAYRQAGVTQFLFHGHPDLEAMMFFGAEVLPRIRRREGVDATTGTNIRSG